MLTYYEIKSILFIYWKYLLEIFIGNIYWKYLLEILIKIYIGNID